MSKVKPVRIRNPHANSAPVPIVIPAPGVTIVPNGLTPNRKWFANLIAAAITWLVVKLGLDSATAASVAAPAAGLIANYLWAEWRSLPETVRSAVGKLVRVLRREAGEANLGVLFVLLGIGVGLLLHWALGVFMVLIGIVILLRPYFSR